MGGFVFLQYPLTADTLSVVINPERLYVKVVAGIEQSHGFLHDGTQVQYFPVEGNIPYVQELLRQPSLGYLSISKTLSQEMQTFFLHTFPAAHVVEQLYDHQWIPSKKSFLYEHHAG